jgi:hypothetical protein
VLKTLSQKKKKKNHHKKGETGGIAQSGGPEYLKKKSYEV